MTFTFRPQALEGVVLIEPQVYTDARGTFVERYKQSEFAAAGIDMGFVQDNHSVSTRGVLRGIHYQLPPHDQGKLVWVSAGAIWDVAVDLRRDSDTFGRWHGAELNSENGAMLYMPPGFGHGFLVLSETADVQYKCTREYDADAERGVRWDDPDLAIAWPSREVTVSAKDAGLPPLAAAQVFETTSP